ncbi:hypothetical protein JTE90_022284 [Oedothorax gibbosus]|uniref:Uncharacterized protein n=1 Tax=Oedothorax gibbosus TaxID=931172 RepID=A0AAV6VYM9_9ARAC|nr:hypothetical protein JTE90_022284 [Oedothorax gibbosus]
MDACKTDEKEQSSKKTISRIQLDEDSRSIIKMDEPVDCIPARLMEPAIYQPVSPLPHIPILLPILFLDLLEDENWILQYFSFLFSLDAIHLESTAGDISSSHPSSGFVCLFIHTGFILVEVIYVASIPFPGIF